MPPLGSSSKSCRSLLSWSSLGKATFMQSLTSPDRMNHTYLQGSPSLKSITFFIWLTGNKLSHRVDILDLGRVALLNSGIDCKNCFFSARALFS